MKALKKVVFLIEEFVLQTPGQQLLDRFLIGYPRDGAFHRLEGCQVSVHLASDNVEIDRRKKDFGLVREAELAAAVANADAIVIVPGGSGAAPNEALIKTALENAREDSCCFIYGVLGASLDGAKKVIQLAGARKIHVLAGTALPVTWRLPEIDLPRGMPLREALIVVQGRPMRAELDGLEVILPTTERRRGGESGVRAVRYLSGKDVWQAGEKRLWSWSLLAVALSRSDTPQGNALKDGRTEDLVGLGLVQELAKDPRGWMIEHTDGLRASILVLDGVVADYNFAVRAHDGTVVSAQVYRPPPPAEHHYSRLAAVMENFFRTAKPPWPFERNLLIVGLLDAFKNSSGQRDALQETPQLANLRYLQ